MKKISPLGKRNGAGTFDEFWDTDKYDSVEQASKKNDTVIIDFVKDESDIIYLEFYHTKNPDVKTHYKLMYQFFPLGVDTRDDDNACEIANKILKENK